MAAEHEDRDRQYLQRRRVEDEPARRQAQDAEHQVNGPMRHTSGGDGRTSPVTIISTISAGVRIAWPLITRPTVRNSTCTTLWMIERSM